jgi:hypothetical protein
MISLVLMWSRDQTGVRGRNPDAVWLLVDVKTSTSFVVSSTMPSMQVNVRRRALSEQVGRSILHSGGEPQSFLERVEFFAGDFLEMSASMLTEMLPVNIAIPGTGPHGGSLPRVDMGRLSLASAPRCH